MSTSFFDFQNELTARTRAARANAAGRAGVSADSTRAKKEADGAITVAQLTAQIERVLKTGLPSSILVKGEVSNFKLHAGSGHAYFTLKDAEACINCVMFRGEASKLKFQVSDGMELLAAGRVGVYPQRGSYQLYISRLDPLGQGALELAFRQLCEKLQAEGLFDASRKKSLPPYPARIALVTSSQTAAFQDMLKVLRRFPWLKLMLYHVPVQGEGAGEQIAEAIRTISRRSAELGGVDALILARGGGSLEDLWEFNEEAVARAICASRIPVVTGIGHEIDVSIADLVADYHAHTPTEAAQVITAQWRNAPEDIDAFTARLASALKSTVQERRLWLESIERHEFFRRPMDRLQARRQQIESLRGNLRSIVNDRVNGAELRLNLAAVRLSECSPKHLLARKRATLDATEMRLLQYHPRQLFRLKGQELSALEARLALVTKNAMTQTRSTLDLLERHLHAIGPRQVLARGYSITTLKKGGAVVRSKSQIKPGQRLITHVADGQIESVAEDPDQPTLFE